MCDKATVVVGGCLLGHRTANQVWKLSSLLRPLLSCPRLHEDVGGMLQFGLTLCGPMATVLDLVSTLDGYICTRL